MHDRSKRPSFLKIIEDLLASPEYAFPGTDMRELVEYEKRIRPFLPASHA
jgi:hypothetical protein